MPPKDTYSRSKVCQKLVNPLKGDLWIKYEKKVKYGKISENRLYPWEKNRVVKW